MNCVKTPGQHRAVQLGSVNITQAREVQNVSRKAFQDQSQPADKGQNLRGLVGTDSRFHRNGFRGALWRTGGGREDSPTANTPTEGETMAATDGKVAGLFLLGFSRSGTAFVQAGGQPPGVLEA